MDIYLASVLWIIVNNAVMNTCIQVFICIFICILFVPQLFGVDS